MRFPYWFLAVFGTVLFSFGCQPPAEEASAPEAAEEATMSDEDMLDTQITAFAEAWNRGDAAAVAALFTEDGNSVTRRVKPSKAGRRSRLAMRISSVACTRARRCPSTRAPQSSRNRTSPSPPARSRSRA